MCFEKMGTCLMRSTAFKESPKSELTLFFCYRTKCRLFYFSDDVFFIFYTVKPV